MAFCQKCGTKLADGAKFCPNCGTSSNTVESGAHNTRVQKFEGEIRKCPNCGAVLKSFQSVCPECGHELRNIATSAEIAKFVKKLKNASSDNVHKIIDAFIIPNSREEILEFLILAGNSIGIAKGMNEINSWAAKIEQAYQKAKFSFGSAPEFKQVEEIKEFADKTQKKAIRKKKTKPIKIIMIVVGSLFLVYGPIFNWSKISTATVGLSDMEKEFTVKKENVTLPGSMGICYELASDVEFKITEKKEVTLIFSVKCLQEPQKALKKKYNLNLNGGLQREGKYFIPFSEDEVWGDDNCDAIFGIPEGKTTKIIYQTKIHSKEDVKELKDASEYGVFSFRFFRYYGYNTEKEGKSYRDKMYEL